jgi:tungstate transport system substrate-binding protein
MRRTASLWVVSVILLAVAAFAGYAQDAEVLRIATTTSTDNTGLLDYLAPRFQQDTGIELQWVAVGTGRALALGRNCDVDALMVHAPAAEKEFVDQGHGVNRQEFMFNDFVIIGPPSDPADVQGLEVTDALDRIAAASATFASRGDDSGTHKKELALWEAAGLPVPDRSPWYVQTGQGMLPTITIATERDAYVLTDRGTYIKYEDNWDGDPPLLVLVEGSPILRNQYSVIAVSTEACPNVAGDLADQFIQWITGGTAQQLIGAFRLMGKRLFTPNAL